jgi:hypothetical protein
MLLQMLQKILKRQKKLKIKRLLRKLNLKIQRKWLIKLNK